MSTGKLNLHRSGRSWLYSIAVKIHTYVPFALKISGDQLCARPRTRTRAILYRIFLLDSAKLDKNVFSIV